MHCPTCNKSGLLVTTTVCPRCETQITSDYDLEDNREMLYKKEHSLLKGKVVELAQKKERAEEKNGRYKGYLTVLGLLLFSIFMFKKTPAPVMVENTKAIDSLYLENTNLQNQIEELKNQTPLSTPNSIKYEVQEGDNLMKISRLFYNNDTLLSKLMEVNNIRNKHKIRRGDTLTIYFQ